MLKFFLWFALVCPQLVASPVKLIVGTSPDYPPFEFKQGEEVTGFDIDLINEVAKELGAEIQIKDMGFSALLNALKHDEIHLIISSVSSTEERKKTFDFSIPYYFDELVVLHKKDMPHTSDQLEGKTVACQMGSAMHLWLIKNAPKSKILPMDLATQMAESLKIGHVDAVLIDGIQAKEFIKNAPELAYTVVGNSGEGCSVVLKKGSALLPKINNAITKLKNNGTIEQLEKKWIKEPAERLQHKLFDDFVFVARGLPTTLLYGFLSVFLGGILGIFFAVSRHLNFGTWLIQSLVSVIRGTPLLLQLGFIYFSLPSLIGVKLSVLAAGVLTLGLNSSCFMAEILRSGLQSLPKGQFEACQALGISNFHKWKDIILPQVIRNVFPSLMNEIVTITKETALISVLGEMDILRRAQTLAAETYDYFLPMTLAGIVYYLLVKSIEFIGSIIEKRWYHA